MSTEPLNTSSIQNFINTVKSADAGQAREVKLNIQQAKALAFTLGVVMSRLHGDLEKLVKENANNADDTVEVQMDGGNKW